MHYHFIEIGTSDFDTCIQSADACTRGISIEPIKYYLDRLPNPLGVEKINAAISADDRFGKMDVYWVPSEIIAQHNLPDWLRGCNSVGAPHKQHTLLGVLDLVQVVSVRTLPIWSIWDVYHVSGCDLLKVDTEGQDVAILNHLWNDIVASERGPFPKIISFEANGLTNRLDVDELLQKYYAKGYRVVSDNGHDIVIRRQ